MAAKRALLIGPSYSPDLPSDICGPLDGPENDVRLMKDMLSKSGFQSEDIEVRQKVLNLPCFTFKTADQTVPTILTFIPENGIMPSVTITFALREVRSKLLTRAGPNKPQNRWTTVSREI